MEILKPLAQSGGDCTAATTSSYFGGYSLNTISKSVDEYYFNGAGSLNGNYYGAGGSGSFSGSYSMEGSCLGNMSLSTGGTFFFVIVEGNNAPELDMISTNKGISFREILKPMQ